MFLATIARDDFTFVIGSNRFCCNRFQTAFLSLLIANALSADPTVNEFVIHIPSSEPLWVIGFHELRNFNVESLDSEAACVSHRLALPSSSASSARHSALITRLSTLGSRHSSFINSGLLTRLSSALIALFSSLHSPHLSAGFASLDGDRPLNRSSAPSAAVNWVRGATQLAHHALDALGRTRRRHSLLTDDSHCAGQPLPDRSALAQ
jgi:hypothetical protein